MAEAAEIDIGELKKKVGRIEGIPNRWIKNIWAERLAALPGRVQQPVNLWGRIIFLLNVLWTPVMLLVLLLLALSVIVTAAGSVVIGAGWWWEKLKKEPIGALVILLTLSGFLAAIDAEVSRLLSPKTVLLISPFELTNTPPMVLPITGKTAASLLKDEVGEIVRKAKAEAGPSESKESYGGKAQTGETDKGTGPRLAGLGEQRKISADIEVEGISIEKIMALYDSIRVDERHVEGDVVFSEQPEEAEPELKLVSGEKRESPCRVSLQARMQDMGSWKTAPHRCDEQGLKEAAHELAEVILGDFSPVTLVLYEQNEERKKEHLQLLRKLVARDPKNVRSLLDLAGALSRQEDYSGAIAEYREILKLNPSFPEEVHDGLGFALYRLGQNGEAEREYRMAIQLNGGFTSPHVNLGYLLKNDGETDEALKEFRRALQINPKDPDSHDGYGSALDDDFRVDEAIEEYREAVRLRPDRWDYHVDLGTELEKKGHLDGAITEYREFVRQKPRDPWAHADLAWVLAGNGEFEEAIQEAGEALKLKDKFAVAHAYLGAVYEAQGNRAGAIKEYQEAIDLKAQESDSPMDERTAFITWAGWHLGLVYRINGDYAAYKQTFEKYIQQCGDCREANVAARQYADTLRLEQDFQNAISWYEYALQKKDQRDSEALTGLGYTFDDMSEEKKAYEAFHGAESLLHDENDEDLHVGLGTVLENAGLRPDAIREYRQALKIRPDSAEASRALATALESEGEYEEARRVRVNAWASYKLAVDRRPGDPDAHTDLGNVLVERGQYSAALREFAVALAPRPWYFFATNANGAALDAFFDEPAAVNPDDPTAGHQERAIAQFRLSIASKPNYAWAHRNLADALDVEGHHAEAIQEYQKILEDRPKDIWARTALGMTYDDIGEFDLAIELHQTAIGASDEFVHFVGEAFGFPEGHSNLCRALNHKGDYGAAIPECRQALALCPHENEAHLNLADALINKAEHCRNCWSFLLRQEARREYKAAAEDSERGLRAHPDALTHYIAGRARAGMGQINLAIVHFQDALAWKPIYPRAHFELGKALRAAGDMEGAAQEFAVAQKQDPLLVEPLQ